MARRARLHKSSVYAAVKAGRLRGYRVSGRLALRFRVEDVDRWLAAVPTDAREAQP